MVTYYIGNIRQKRMLFREKRAGAAVADNSDVLADFRLNGKVCFVLGDVPYGDMRVGEYLAYARALKTRLPLSDAGVRALLRRVGVRVRADRKMRSLPRELFRGVLLAAAFDDGMQSAWINLDGVAYSFFTRARVRKLVRGIARRFGEVHVAVSDHRFIPRKAHTLTAASGVLTECRVRSRSRRLGKLRFRRIKRAVALSLGNLQEKQAVLCDN
ncbi:MAG: hypothetical protein K2L51_05085 [Clostridiales bacterium]|nr:hypothetical protein [Clostridiales bacterium]